MGSKGVMGGDGPSWAALKALSGSGVSGSLHLRTVEDDVIYTFKGDGGVEQVEETVLS